jgi:HSP20 family protein
MAIIRWHPFRDLTGLDSDLGRIRREMDHLFGLMRGGQVDDDTFGSFWSPSVDIIEHDDAFIVEAELPGMSKDDVKTSIEGNILTIKGEKKQEQAKEGKNYHRTERVYGSFMRSFTLPTSVRTDKIEASYKNGILTVRIPKAEEAKSKSIEVKIQ